MPIHIIPEEIKEQTCAICGKKATHKFSETVWRKSDFISGSLTGFTFDLYFCCEHFIELLAKDEIWFDETKELCQI